MYASGQAMFRASQCDSVPVLLENELQGMQVSKSLARSCTTFLAFMVDTQDFVSQMRSTYVKELWPRFCAELTDSKVKVIRLEKELVDSKKDREESRLLFNQEVERLRMANEDERCRLLSQIDEMQRRMEEERSRSRAECEAINYVMDTDDPRSEDQKQNQELQQRIEMCDKANTELIVKNGNLRDELLKRVEEIEELKKAAELASLKHQLQEKQRMLQEDSENRYKREKRLSLRRERRSTGQTASLCVPWKGQQAVVDGNSPNPMSIRSKKLVESVSKLQGSLPEPKSHQICAPDGEVRSQAPTIVDLTPAIRRVDFGANGAPQVPQLDLLFQAGHTPVGPVLGAECENVEDIAAPNLQPSSGPKPTDSERAGLRAPTTRVVDSDETTMEASLRMDISGLLEVEEPVSSTNNEIDVNKSILGRSSPTLCAYDYIDDPPTIDSKHWKKDTSFNCSDDDCLQGVDEFSAHSSDRHNGPMSTYQRDSSKGRRPKQREAIKTVQTPAQGQYPTKTHNSTGKTIREQKWRQTRSRNEETGGDPHDSFLNTPREIAVANIKSREQPDNITAHMPLKSAPATVPARPKHKGQLATPLNRLKGSTDAVMVGSDNEKHLVSSKASAVQSTCAIEGAEKKEKLSRALEGVPTNMLEKERQGLSSKTPTYKYNEPVRKKRDREQLEGTDCEQCRKFYDAVLAEDADGVTMDRCEHHDAVSRHRYKYLPPGTPAGFWNIGFESEF